jgi:sigma-B regulation protein RsbU (phosphoserine phosphatase)
VATAPGGPTLRRRATLAGFVALAVVLVLGALIAVTLVSTALAGRDVLSRLQPASDASRDVLLHYGDADMAISDAVLDGLTGSVRTTVVGGPGCTASLACYEQSMSDAAAALRRVRVLLPDEPEILSLANETSARAATWDAADGTPAFSALAMNDPVSAASITRSPAAQISYDRLVAAAQALENAIDATRASTESQLGDIVRTLAALLGLGGLAVLLLLLAGTLLMGRWVLTPLDGLGRQLRGVAQGGDHHRPIAPSGPPEIVAVGTDAEAMRRRLVEEIDQSRAAREALVQQGPVVAGLAEQLAATRVDLPGWRIYGTQQPAEGVLAGDFWDAEVLPDGRISVILCDVSGHGAEAGLTALRIKTVVGVVLAAGFGPNEALSRAALSMRAEDSRFATVVVWVLDPDSDRLVWANAGHHAPLVMRDSNGNGRPDIGEGHEYLGPTGPMLSGLGGEWAEQATTLSSGDVVIAWSDGLTESHDAAGEELGPEGLIALLDDARRGPTAVDAAADPTELVERVLAAARNRAVDWRRDDVTLLAVSRAPR